MENIEKIKKYIEEKIDITDIADSQKDEVISSLLTNISKATIIASFKQLNVEERKEFLVLYESKKYDKIFEYLKSKIKNLPLLVGQATEETINEFNRLRIKD